MDKNALLLLLFKIHQYPLSNMWTLLSLKEWPLSFKRGWAAGSGPELALRALLDALG